MAVIMPGRQNEAAKGRVQTFLSANEQNDLVATCQHNKQQNDRTVISDKNVKIDSLTLT